MPLTCLRWMWRHRVLTLCLGLAFALILLNIIAYNQAYSMTHFASAGARTPGPKSLSLGQKVQAALLGVRVLRPTNAATPESLGMPFQTHRFASKDGIELEGWSIAHPDPKGLVLLAHGYASCKGSLLREAQAYHDMGYTTFLLDLRGSGGSSGDETTIGVLEADDVAEAVVYLQANFPDQPIILYGQSMGSVAILRAIAENGVQPRAVIIECPFDRLVSTVANRFSAMGLPSFPGAQLLVFWGGVQHGFNGFRHNPVDYAKKTNCPVLLMHGAKDPRVTPQEVESVFENLAGEKKLEVFDDVGHESYVGAKTELWKSKVSQFLHGYSSGERKPPD